MDIKAQIKDKLKKALLDLGIEDLEIELEQPKELSFGDYATNVAMVAFKNIKSGLSHAVRDARQELAKSSKASRSLSESSKTDLMYSQHSAQTAFSSLTDGLSGLNSSLDLAQKIVSILNTIRQPADQIKDTFDRAEAVGGFINFHLSANYLSTWIKEVLGDNEKLVNKARSSSNKIVVEYSSPNIAKPFTIGHLRSTIIGDVIANLLEATGGEVYRDNHIGDWGSQFGKQIYAIKTWGNEEDIEKAENPVKELVNLYIKFHEEAEKDPKLEDYSREWFKKLEEGDREARRLWQRCIDWSWMEFDRLYKELDVKFTENNGQGYGESFFEDKMKQIIEELKEKNLLKKDQGASLVYFENDKLPPLMILKQDGTTLYATRDLATDKFRLEKYGKDVKIINEVGAEQSLYFQQLFELEKMLGWFNPGQRVHVRHGLYRFKDQKMSTRKGNVIWLEELLDEAEKKAFALRKSTQKFEGHDVISKSTKYSKSAQESMPGFGVQVNNARVIGIGALKWNDLKRNSVQDIVFDWEDILNMQGDSGPYMQYTYARTQSIFAKSEIRNPKSEIKDWKLEKEESDLLRYLFRYSDIVNQAADDLSPNILCSYLFNLAQRFNLFYQKYKVIGSEKEEQRLALVGVTGMVLKHGLNILGIKAPEKI